MPTETIVAVFDTAPHAEAAVNDLIAAGIPANSIEHYAQSYDAAGTAAEPEHRGFWAWLTGDSEVTREHHALYDQSIRSGGTVVTVVAEHDRIDEINDILDRHDPIDLDERHSQYSATGVYGDAPVPVPVPVPAPVAAAAVSLDSPAATAPHADPSSALPMPDLSGTAGTDRRSEEVIALSEETLEVGKRTVDRGTTRVRRYVVERPVEEQIKLRNETVSVFRRPVGAGATVGADAFTDREIVMTETDEEVVVSKTAHVVEEVVVQKGVEEHVETIRDTLRREEVEIEGPGHQSLTGTTPRTTSGA
ncbi:YsnF/AvaK domain-containing protein [Lichenicola sp.]|uniref:YsnF/AvaK domain-containing protein n=1 Tax=Lichenicola sp. TaxID=2804529 RepID=UPI003AFFE0BF